MKLNRLLPIAAVIFALAGCSVSPKLNPVNIDQVIKAMTIQEKADLVVSRIPDNMSEGASRGAISTVVIERLGIPSVTIAAAGSLADGDATRFPSPLMMASSWDINLIEHTAIAAGSMEANNGCDILLAPNLNILRNPLGGDACGRFSEDPLVSGRSAAATVRGLERAGVGASVGYLAAANQCSCGDHYDACISPRTLREIYLKGFETVMSESQPVAVTLSDNKVNGEWVATNSEMLGTLLRQEWKFEGAVIGSSNYPELAPAKIAAGCDLLQPSDFDQRDSIITCVNDGRISMAALDSSVKNVLKLIASTPQFQKTEKVNEDRLAINPEEEARAAAAQSIILLENRYQALPLVDSLAERVIIFEEASDSLLAIKPALEIALGDTGCQICADADSADIALVVITRRSRKGDRRITDFMLTDTEMALISGTCSDFHGDDRYVAVVLNIDAVIETASWKEQPDAILLAFDAGSEAAGALADVITGAENPSGHLTVTFPNHLIMYPSMHNFPVRSDAEDEKHNSSRAKKRPAGNFARGTMPPSPGNLTGTGRDTTGRARRMRHMFALSAKDSADRASMGVRNKDYILYQEGLFVGYRFFTSFEREVSYPFGHGLSYTTFEYGEPDVIVRRNSLRVYVDITNTGSRAGREVVQVYAVTPESSLDKPLLGLVDYQKTPALEPGEKYTATFTIPFDALASFNGASSAWSVDAGSYILKIGPSSADIRSEAAAVLDNPYSVHTNDILQLHHRIDELHLRRSIFRERVRGGGFPTLNDTVPSEANPQDSTTINY